MARILVGIPSAHPDHRFLESLPYFLASAREVHQVEEYIVKDKPIAEAYNEIAFAARESHADYLLTLEDDHWDFTIQMLDSLIAADHPITAIPYYSRHYPYQKTAFIEQGLHSAGFRKGHIRLVEANYESGAHEVDIVGLGMTLFETWIFRELDPTYFEPLPLAAKEIQQRLLQRVKAKYGIRPKVIFDYILPHGDLTKENISQHRELKLSKGTALRHRAFSIKQTKSIQKVIEREQELSNQIILN